MGFFCRPDLSDTTKSGRRIARVKDDDRVVTASPGDGDTITAASEGGKVLTFPADELPELAGAGRGVILMRLDDEDSVVGVVCHPLDQTPIAVDEEGNERRFHLPEAGHRGQKGRKALKRFKPAELRPRSEGRGTKDED
jgi:DNA gyrase/topoisomerase IV subunit A